MKITQKLCVIAIIALAVMFVGTFFVKFPEISEQWESVIDYEIAYGKFQQLLVWTRWISFTLIIFSITIFFWLESVT